MILESVSIWEGRWQGWELGESLGGSLVQGSRGCLFVPELELRVGLGRNQ